MTYNSMKEFQDAVYAEAIKRKNLNDMCAAECKKNTVKAKVRSSKDDGSSMNMTSCNLSSLSQDYVNNHYKITKTGTQHIECGPSYERSYLRKSQTNASTRVDSTISKSLEITGSVQYGACSVESTASISQTTNTQTENSSMNYSEDSVKIALSENGGGFEIWYNSYTCSDSTVLDVSYNFDTIKVCAACTYKDECGTPFQSGAVRHEDRSYNLADLGFYGPFVIKTPVVFNVSFSDEWPNLAKI